MANQGSSWLTGKSKRICLVTADLMDFGSRAEVAASMAGIAELFVSQGNEVTILWVPAAPIADEEEIKKLKNYYYNYLFITLEVLTESKGLLPLLDYPEKKSIAVYHYLKEHSFSVVYLSLDGGLPYYTVLARETGMFMPRCDLVVVAHAPLHWLSESDRFFLRDIDQVTVSHMEKLSVELADRLICFSKSMVDWLKSHDWKLPGKVDVLPFLAPAQWRLRADSKIRREAVGQSDELAFLGFPDFRDGLMLFCDAVDELAKRDVRQLKLTMFGPFGQLLGEHTGGMFLRRARRWPFEIQIFARMGYREILEYLCGKRALAVIPSLASATGHWVAACLETGIPFVATNAGANEDVLSESPGPHQRVVASAKDLAAQVAAALKTPALASPANRSDARRAAWLDETEKAVGPFAAKPQIAMPGDNEPLVSVVMVHHDRPQYLLQAISAVERQTYRNIELVLVDDGSALPESKSLLDRLEPRFKSRGWKILRQENKYLGAARNFGIRESQGEFVLIVDDDNALFRDAVRKFVHAIQTSGSDICTSFHKNLTGDSVPLSEKSGEVHYLPLGGSLDRSFIMNSFGDANAIIRRSVFDKIGLQNDTYGFTANDWEFYVRASLAGLKLRVIPEPLYWYRSSTESMYRSSHWYSNRLPILAAFKKHNFAGLDFVYHLAISKFALWPEIYSLRENLHRAPSDTRFLRLSEQENPNSAEAIELLAENAAAEGRPDTAIALLGRAQTARFQPAILDRLSSQPYYESALRELAVGVTVERRFGHRELMRFEASTCAHPDQTPMCYVESPDKFFLRSEGGDIAFAVLPAGCPSSAISAFATVSLDQELTAPAEMLLMLVPFHVDPAVAVEAAARSPAEASSGWCQLSRAFTPNKIEALLSVPTDKPLNVIVAIRNKAEESASVLGCFSELGVTLSPGNRESRRPRLGPPPTKRRARALTRDELGKVQLVSSFPSELPLLLLDPGDGGLFLRPNDKGPTIASIGRGFPPFARGLIGRVEIAHAAASPFEFSLALVPPASPIEWVGEKPRSSRAFSGWVRVEQPFRLHDVTVALREVSASPLNIILGIRLPSGSVASPASSFWRKLVLTWDE